MTRLEAFAAAALTGILARHVDEPSLSDNVRLAWTYANDMEIEAKRRAADAKVRAERAALERATGGDGPYIPEDRNA